MLEDFQQLLYPFVFYSNNYLAMLLIAVLISVLGLYAVCKRVVFVGMALAEISAAGIGFAFFSFSVLAGYGLLPEWWHQSGVGISSILFALLGVVFFALWHPPERLSRESVIGAGYAVASGLALLLVWKSAEGLEELNNLIHGDVLFVTVGQLSILAMTTAVIFGFHTIFAKEILFVAYDRDMAMTLGYNARLWELLLFGTLGLAIALSTWIGGLLMVFGLLVMPAIGALGSKERIIASLGSVVVQSVTAVTFGFILANSFDNPAPPMIVLVQFGLMVLLIFGRQRPMLRGLATLVFVIGSLFATLATTLSLADALFDVQLVSKIAAEEIPMPVRAHPDEVEVQDLLKNFAKADQQERIRIIVILKDHGGSQCVNVVIEALKDPNEEVALAAIQALGTMSDRRAVDPVWRCSKRFPEDDAILEIARTLLALKDPRGVTMCIDLMAKSRFPFIRMEALNSVKQGTTIKEAMGYQALSEPDAAINVKAIARWHHRVEDHSHELFEK
jgi:ABC-type Mn2+/Zn2+ transport system permease subunit